MDERTSQDCQLALNDLVTDWDSISLLPQDLQRSLAAFQGLLSAHNEMMRPGITFFDTNFRTRVIDQLSQISLEGSKLVGPLILVAKDS